MPTSSLEKGVFQIADEESTKRFLEAMEHPREVEILDKDLEEETAKGLEILRSKDAQQQELTKENKL